MSRMTIIIGVILFFASTSFATSFIPARFEFSDGSMVCGALEDKAFSVMVDGRYKVNVSLSKLKWLRYVGWRDSSKMMVIVQFMFKGSSRIIEGSTLTAVLSAYTKVAGRKAGFRVMPMDTVAIRFGRCFLPEAESGSTVLVIFRNGDRLTGRLRTRSIAIHSHGRIFDVKTDEIVEVNFAEDSDVMIFCGSRGRLSGRIEDSLFIFTTKFGGQISLPKEWLKSIWFLRKDCG